MNYTPKTIKEQAEIIENSFGIKISYPETMPLLPEKAEHYFLIPKWDRVGKTYAQAVNAVIAAIKKQRNGKVYQWNEFTDENLRPLERNIPEIIAAQFGELHKGESVESVRNNKGKNEGLLGLYEISVMLLTHPERLEKYEDLWIDCAGDEYSYAGGAFSGSPVLVFCGRVGFGTRDVGFADDGFGASSLFFPQSNLETGSLEPFDSLSLESAIKVVKEAGYKVTKEI